MQMHKLYKCTMFYNRKCACSIKHLILSNTAQMKPYSETANHELRTKPNNLRHHTSMRDPFPIP